jgi:hypothetical protein
MLALALIAPPSKAKRFWFSRFEMNTCQYGSKRNFFQRISKSTRSKFFVPQSAARSCLDSTYLAKSIPFFGRSAAFLLNVSKPADEKRMRIVPRGGRPQF